MAVPLMALWLPILISAVLIFIASNILWMVLKFWHYKDYQRVPDDKLFVDATRALKAGMYVFPWMDWKTMTPEQKAEATKGPMGFMILKNPASFSFECVLMRPRSRGRVTLRSADPAAPPRIVLPSLSEQLDLDRLGEAALRARDVALQPELRAICRDAPTQLPGRGVDLDAWVRENAYSVPHVVGTCAMGPSPADGAVVDADGRVHGVERLRVVDASIIPEPPSGFPNLITMMIAERIAATF